jgi:hypothetical protein
VPSFKAPTGDTTASRIKTLVLYAERVKGRADADELLQDIGVQRDLLKDETRPVSVAIWRRALEQFARRYGAEAIADTRAEVVHPSNLGPWIPLLRSADRVEDAFRLLEAPTTHLSSTTRFETLSSSPTSWRGRVHVLHDPTLERGGLLSAARSVELSAVPTLYGLAPAIVRERASLERGDGFYEYDVAWPAVGLGAWGWGMPVIPALAFVASGWFSFGPKGGAALGVVGAALGWLAGKLYRDDLVRRAQVHAQSMRIRALERSLELQEHPQFMHAGDLDGQVIAGLYRLHARIGSGATGVIYEALRLSDRTPVAIKLLRAAVAQDIVASDRLAREAEALRLTWHPNVVELFDHGTLPDGSSYIVMELLRGESLAARLSRGKGLPPRETLAIFDQLCEALSAMHAAGVIHRDLKPSNVYLCEPSANLRASSHWVPKDPSAPRVKIFDFGIARVEWAETRITHHGVPLGTPGYMAPEQEAGDPVDHRCDLYALGATLYECVTGKPPPLRGSAGAEAAAARWADDDEIDDRWKAIVDKAMAPRPEDRFADAKALGAALVGLSPKSAAGED